MSFEEKIEKIKKLKDIAERFKDMLSKNEMLTRYCLVDPLLRLMGWDLEDPNQVIPEFSTEKGRPDYALLEFPQKPIAFIGVKALGRSEDISQYITYCNTKGAKYFETHFLNPQKNP